MNKKFILLLFLIQYLCLNFILYSAEENWKPFELKLKPTSCLYTAVECADIDFDGDNDLFAGNWNGFITFFENTGSPLSPAFQLKKSGIDKKNSFFNIYTVNKSIPRFADIDNDNDLDLFIGDNSGCIFFFENTGKMNDPVFTEKSGLMTNLKVEMAGSPCFADIDNDGDLDLFIGNALGFLAFFNNEGIPSAPKFKCINTGKDQKDSFAGIKADNYAVPLFFDIDNDGKYDLFIGGYDGTISYYQNIGDQKNYKFQLITKNFANIKTEGDTSLCFADLNNDGINELLIGDNQGKIMAFTAPDSFRTKTAVKPKDPVKSLLHEKSYAFFLNKVKEQIIKKDYIEALNLLYSMPDKKDTLELNDIKEGAEQELDKIYKRFMNDSFLYEEIDPYFKKAVEYYIESEYEKAVKQFNKVLAIIPNHNTSILYKNRAIKRIKLSQDKKQAEELYNKALSSYKTNKENAFTSIQKAWALQPENIEYERIFLHYSNEYFLMANKEYYNKSIKKTLELMKAKKYNEAGEILSSLQEKFSNDEKVTNLLNICVKNSTAMQNAENIKLKEMYLFAGDESFNKSDFTNALKNYQIAYNYSRDKQIKEKIALTRINIDKKARRILDPQGVKEHFQKGMTHYSLGQYQEAITEWQKVLELDPRHVMAQNNIAKAKKMTE